MPLSHILTCLITDVPVSIHSQKFIWGIHGSGLLTFPIFLQCSCGVYGDATVGESQASLDCCLLPVQHSALIWAVLQELWMPAPLFKQSAGTCFCIPGVQGWPQWWVRWQLHSGLSSNIWNLLSLGCQGKTENKRGSKLYCITYQWTHCLPDDAY